MKKFIYACIAFVVIAAVSICLIMYVHKKSDGGASGIKYTPDQPKQWSEEISQANQSDGIKIPGFGRVYFPSGTTKVQMTLANPSDNDCYFIYNIHLDNPDGELLYTSAEVYPGMALYDLTLSRPLNVGEHMLYINIVPYDTTSKKQLNSALLKAPLTVSEN